MWSCQPVHHPHLNNSSIRDRDSCPVLLFLSSVFSCVGCSRTTRVDAELLDRQGVEDECRFAMKKKNNCNEDPKSLFMLSYSFDDLQVGRQVSDQTSP